jgi:hypothetical protein
LVIVADDGSGLRPRRDSKSLGLALIARVSDGVDLVHRAAGGLELRMRFVLAPPQRGACRVRPCAGQFPRRPPPP